MLQSNHSNTAASLTIHIGYEDEDEVMMSKWLIEEGFVQGGVVWVLELSCEICSDPTIATTANSSP